MDYLYYLGNASLILRAVRHLKRLGTPRIQFVTVIHQLDGWVLRVHCSANCSEHELLNLKAYLDEIGVVYEPSRRILQVLAELEMGRSPVEVMQQYQVAVIAHGEPELSEIEAFRQQFIQGLGYCPETLG